MKISCLQNTVYPTFVKTLKNLSAQLEELHANEWSDLTIIGAHAISGDSPLDSAQRNDVTALLSLVANRTGTNILLGAFAEDEENIAAYYWDSNGKCEPVVLERGEHCEDPFLIINIGNCRLALVHPDEIWIPEVPRCAALAGVDAIVALGATNNPAEAQRTELLWGMSALLCTPLIFMSPCSINNSLCGASAFAWPNRFQFRMTNAQQSTSVEITPEAVKAIREPDLRFKNSLWYCLWGRRPELYTRLTTSREAI